MADRSVRVVGCLLALLTVSTISMVGPVTAGVAQPELTANEGTVSVIDDPAWSNGPVFSNTPPSPDTDNTVTRIQVSKPGNATWSLQIRTRLETDAEVKNYRIFMDRFRNNTSDYLGPFSDSITTIVGNAEQATGREMSASNFEASTSIQTVPRRWGVVTYEFTWSGFAVTDGSRLVVGDIFQGGYFIAENDTLVISGPASYTITSVEPSPDQRDDSFASWDGRKDFAGGYPHVEFAPASGQDANDANNQATGILPSTPLVGVLGGLAIVIAGAIMVARRRGLVLGDNEPLAGGAASTSTTDGGASTRTGGNRASAAVSPDKKDRELLADVDKVTRVLEEAGGRMKQSEIGEELDWSKAKTSRVLSRLEDDGKIEKLRLGRENVIDLADDDDGRDDASSGSGDDGSGDDSSSDDSGSEYGYSP